MLSKTICLCTNGLRLKETRALPTGVISWNSRHAPQSIRSYVSETHSLLTVSVSQTTQTVSSYATHSFAFGLLKTKPHSQGDTKRRTPSPEIAFFFRVERGERKYMENWENETYRNSLLVYSLK
ncbi:LOW QUALITY PROTEIN: hypothetical protein YC2023_025057 [Brassica napus]